MTLFWVVIIAFETINAFKGSPAHSFYFYDRSSSYQCQWCQSTEHEPKSKYLTISLPRASLFQSLSREKTLTQHHCHANTETSTSESNDENNKISNSVGIVCVAGIDPDDSTKRINQDSSFYFTHFLQMQEKCYKLSCAGVLDGHGKDGHKVSSYFSQEIPVLFKRVLKLDENVMSNNNVISAVQNACKDAFEESHKNACKDSSVPCSRSGSTCVMAIVIEEQIENGKGEKIVMTANVGDSRAILGFNSFSKFLTIQLSQETTIQQPKERERIESSRGGRIVQGNVFYGPIGISMTRALGDSFMINAGVIPTPDIRIFNVTEMIEEYNDNSSDEIVVVLGSDGIFDVLSNTRVIELVMSKVKGKNLKATADLIAEKALQKWKNDLPLDVRVDDITCIIMNLV